MAKVIWSTMGSSQTMKITPKPKLTLLDYFFGGFLIWVVVTATNILIVLFIFWI